MRRCRIVLTPDTIQNMAGRMIIIPVRLCMNTGVMDIAEIDIIIAGGIIDIDKQKMIVFYENKKY